MITETTGRLTLEATFEGETKDPFGPGTIGVSASGQLNRMDYGLNWDGLAGAIPPARAIRGRGESACIADSPYWKLSVRIERLKAALSRKLHLAEHFHRLGSRAASCQ